MGLFEILISIGLLVGVSYLLIEAADKLHLPVRPKIENKIKEMERKDK